MTDKVIGRSAYVLQNHVKIGTNIDY